jgi:hypothetical protein
MRTVKNLFALLASIAFALAAGGCATVIKGTTQRVAVVTEPPGALCTLRNRSSDVDAIVPVTPGEAEVRRGGGPLEVRCAMDGHLDVVESYPPTFGADGGSYERYRQVIVVEALRRQFSLGTAAGPVEDTETKERTAAGVAAAAGVASVALPVTVLATAVPTMGGGAAIAGAGLVAAPLYLFLAAALPISLVVDLASGANFSYPAALMLLLPAATFPDEASRDAYFVEVDKGFDFAREALRLHTDASCAFWNCASRSEQDDAFIDEWRNRFVESRARTQVADVHGCRADGSCSAVNE